ncbi:phosphatidylinositol-binding protein scs2 [Yamadazyma tenuis]|uniref:VAMP-associated protein n=1 Tax=Candida tenuis (strain ATCC 10573 / BCRC 21748 / CBS 615 / JCM 9827 / NBRC 10315 / NRRL Y-1498 / VKM Y-70) TaxID=590646 RepID=G3B214_CANTC|nr:uncharacterized protein CANTEDRAFT_120241 [Yamadazyma tenuis ATCC 10573]XP_006685389.1 VAMP-associated protein [Yamadazyma tenuis ATCC 10573]EGV64582.1 hypothetical protein CANTEDRAFT_120241 [Yamadazyma tenuis ATCC 10573]EGV64583.1 VAMP-associated protein [Yamadazyma tenuis ATCC 10573]WEJ97348.1 phosphatidylinositol-binding protein scs2 [Yamadazyma tenuis]
MEVSPATLEFKGDFLSPSTEYLSISNTSSGPLAFKVKTTAPKLYSVRPNASIVGPGESVKVAIILQAFSQPLSKHYKCKDKFLIVSLPCSSDADASKVGEFWPELEKSNKAALVSKKLRVNYVIESTNDDEIKEESSEKADVGVGTGVGAGVASVGTGAGAVTGAASGAAAAAAAGAATAGSSKNIIDPSKVDEEEITKSYKEINKLNQKFDQTEKEKVVPPTSGSTISKISEPFSGVSLPMTVILMILAFIIGWLIF